MWWKIALAVVAVWLLFGLVVALVKGAAALAVIALVVIGAVSVYRWATGSARDEVTKTPV
jgi:hypothetical protein